jgi:hypothetical protein
MTVQDEQYTEWWGYVLLSEANGQTYAGVIGDRTLSFIRPWCSNSVTQEDAACTMPLPSSS